MLIRKSALVHKMCLVGPEHLNCMWEECLGFTHVSRREIKGSSSNFPTSYFIIHSLYLNSFCRTLTGKGREKEKKKKEEMDLLLIVIQGNHKSTGAMQ